MKKCLMVVAVICLLGTGCARRYQMTLYNGNRITTKGKPKLEGGYYVFRDIEGQTNVIPAGRVSVLEPAPRGSSGSSSVNPSIQR